MKPPPISRAYLRLSREDERQGGTLDEQIALRSSICQRIAAEYGLHLPPENIHFEQVSGAKLSNRPEALKLLALARDGQLPHLITPYLDRLLRGDKRDEQDFEDAFCIGSTTLYHAEGAPIHFGDDYDPILLEIKSLVARQELRGYSKKLRTTNRERLRQAKRSHGPPPYGYRYIPAQHNDRGEQIAPPRHVTLPEELAIVREIYRRIGSESLQSIADDFNHRRQPPPAANIAGKNGIIWHPSSIGRMVANHFYMGRMVQRRKVVRGREVEIPREDWIVSEAVGDWEPAVTEEEWEAAQRIVQYRRGRGFSNALLTGLLFCAEGEPMSGGAASYTCHCGDRNSPRLAGKERHPGWAIRTAKIEAYARSVVAAVLDALPPQLLAGNPVGGPTAPMLGASLARKWAKQSKKPTVAELSKARRELSEKQRSVEDMIARRSWHIEMFGEDAYSRAAFKVRGETEILKGEISRLEAAAAAPDVAESLPLISGVKRIGVEAWWQRASTEEQSTLLRALVRRMDLHPKAARKMHTGITVSLWDWCKVAQPSIPALATLYDAHKPRIPASRTVTLICSYCGIEFRRDKSYGEKAKKSPPSCCMSHAAKHRESVIKARKLGSGENQER